MMLYGGWSMLNLCDRSEYILLLRTIRLTSNWYVRPWRTELSYDLQVVEDGGRGDGLHRADRP